jgi:hypothetical protein
MFGWENPKVQVRPLGQGGTGESSTKIKMTLPANKRYDNDQGVYEFGTIYEEMRKYFPIYVEAVNHI